jgi:hypothetical protein
MNRWRENSLIVLTKEIRIIINTLFPFAISTSRTRACSSLVLSLSFMGSIVSNPFPFSHDRIYKDIRR